MRIKKDLLEDKKFNQKKSKYTTEEPLVKKFRYVAFDENKKRVVGLAYARDKKELADKLAKKFIYLQTATERKSNLNDKFMTIKLVELQTFCKQLSVLYKTLKGDLVEAMKELSESSFSTAFKNVLQEIYEEILNGKKLYKAMERYPRVFPKFFRTMVNTGEESNTLNDVLLTLSDYYEAQVALKNKVRGALAYPIFLMLMAVGLIVLMFTFVIPNFSSALSSMEVEMPMITIVIFNMSQWFVDNQMTLLIIASVTIVALIIFFNTPIGKYTSSWLALHLPLVRKIEISFLCSRFARAFGLLSNTSVQLIQQLRTVRDVLGNKIYEKAFDAVIIDVQNGVALPDAIKKRGLFNNTLNLLLSTGYSSGDMGYTLNSSASYFNDESFRTLNAAVGGIQPVLLILLGGAIGLMFLAVYSPMLAIMDQLI